MQNKGAIILLAAVVTILCGYYLSFTFIASNYKDEAREYAKDETGKVDIFKRQRYLDSMSNEPVFANAPPNLHLWTYFLKSTKKQQAQGN